jgi:uncharacterized protein (DUF488 family)
MQPVLEPQRGNEEDARAYATPCRGESSGRDAPIGASVWTIGHSTRPLEDFLALLAQHRLEGLIDVRRFPGSRRHPQYGESALRDALAERGIAYRWMPALGGRRRPRPDSANTAWRNDSFRGYADYMETEEFTSALIEVIEQVSVRRTVLMCAEALWWRCHRALIADVLLVRGFEVVHIVDGSHTVAHPYTSAARIVDGKLSYRAADAAR